MLFCGLSATVLLLSVTVKRVILSFRQLGAISLVRLREEFNGNRLAHADGILLPSCLNNSYVCHGDMLLKVRLPCKGSLTFHTLITSYRLPVPLLFLVMLTQAGDEKFRVALPAKTKCDTAG